MLFFFNMDNGSGGAGIFSMLFFIHYGIAIFYWIILGVYFRRRAFGPFSTRMLRGHSLLLILFNISAFSLNREMALFDESVDWLSYLIVIENISLILLTLLKSPSNNFGKVIAFLTPFFLLFHLHQFIALLPMFLIGLVGVLFLGIGMHLYVPIFYVLAWFQWFRKSTSLNKSIAYMVPGCLIVFGSITAYTLFWQGMNKEISNLKVSVDAPLQNDALPLWVEVAKELNDSWLTESYLKGNFVYQKYESFSFGRSRLEEDRVHDPLVMIGMGLSDDSPLDERSRLKILKSIYDKRHGTVDRFWSGNHLSMEQVVTNIELIPTERLSYTEMLLTIANNRKEWMNSQEEAIFTFQLPEGGVITSLSLWINGKEEKGILTTKSKAKRAYDTIVGRERRDPSVIYWMEGNKARIRVFPCTPKENRKFKIGVTAPLKLQSEQLSYTPITFEGPDCTSTKSAINVVNKGQNLNSNFNFKKEGKLFTWHGEYSTNWQLSINAEEFVNRSFRFMNEVYEVRTTQKKVKTFKPKTVYLDIDGGWKKEEIESIKSILSSEKITVLEGLEALTAKAHFPNFTLFPYYKIFDVKSSVIITKGGVPTPNLEDLKGSMFRDNLFDYFKKSHESPIVLDIGQVPSNYNRSLKEFGAINHHLVSINDIKSFFQKMRFPDCGDVNNEIKLFGNDLSIHKVENSTAPTGSDHLMRLFYYQNVMEKIGRKYFQEDDSSIYEDKLTSIASRANIVTPVSSLIVLESQYDYERFGIKKKKDSLGNASINGSGAVPEPHEWALIIAGVLFLLLFYFKRKIALV